MKNLYKITSFICISILFLSCGARVDLDEGQWGDTAYITGVQVFNLDIEDHELQEFYLSGETVPGARRSNLSTFTEVDDVAATLIVTVPTETDLSRVGIGLVHTSVAIQTIAGPKPGIIGDFSGVGPFVYRSISSDGTTRDFTLTFEKTL